MLVRARRAQPRRGPEQDAASKLRASLDSAVSKLEEARRGAFVRPSLVIPDVPRSTPSDITVSDLPESPFAVGGRRRW